MVEHCHLLSLPWLKVSHSIAPVLDPKVFKAYDVRGIYPDELDEAGAEAIGRAYVEQFEPRRMAVGRDMRLSSPAMQEALMRGASAAGADVLDLGLVGTEMVYFAVGSLELDGGAMVTASHNPKQYTGMKLVRRGALPVGGESGLLDVRDRALAASDLSRYQIPSQVRPGQVAPHDIWPAFVERVLSFVDVGAIKPLKVVIDAANGMAGAMLPPVLERLPVDVVRCFFEPDGTFPNHEPNPLLPENREFIVGKTLEEGADLGVAFDGDADRCFFVDDTGEFVPGDFVTALFAESLLEKEPGAKIIYDVRASRAVPETIERAGGTALVNRVGHAFIKARMRKEDAAFAGEVSGHYYFRDFSQADSGVVPFLLMLELISKRGRLSEILAPLRSRYFITGELNTPVADVALKLQELKERYADGRVSHLDGISVDYDDWHFNVRPSNTEPLLRLNLEATSEELMEQKRDEVLDVIRS
jgi:phosphomannomutase